MAGIDFRTLRDEVSIYTVLKLLGFVPVPGHAGGDGQVRGPCPIHAPKREGSRSFSANLKRNAYRCFHCASSGNQLDLWAAATGQPLYQAAIELCAKLNRPVPWLPRRSTDRKKSAPAS